MALRELASGSPPGKHISPPAAAVAADGCGRLSVHGRQLSRKVIETDP